MIFIVLSKVGGYLFILNIVFSDDISNNVRTMIFYFDPTSNKLL